MVLRVSLGTSMIEALRTWVRSRPLRAATLAGWYQLAASMGGAALTIPVVIHSLGEASAGLWFSFQGFVALFGLMDFGFSTAISRQVSYSFHLREGAPPTMSAPDLILTRPGWMGLGEVQAASVVLFRRIVIAFVPICVASYEVLLAWTNLLERRTTESMLIWYLLGASVALTFHARLSQSFLDGLGYMYAGRFVAGTYSLVVCVLSVTVLWFGYGLAGLAVVLAAASGVQWWAMRVALRYVTRGRLVSDPERGRLFAGKLWRVASRFGVMSTGGYLVSAAQAPLIGALLGPAMVAPIYVALKLSQILNSLILQVATVQMPAFTRECTQGIWSRARRRMQITVLLGGGAQLAAAGGMLLLSPQLADWWLGPNHYIYGTVLVVFSVNYAVACVSALPAQFVLASGRNPFAVSTLMHGAISLGGMVLLCPRLGLIGVPLASLVGVLLTNGWVNVLEGWRTWKHLQRPDTVTEAAAA